VKEASLTLFWIYSVNPFTHAVELIRFAMYGRFNEQSAAIVTGYLLLFLGLAVRGYDPGRGLAARRGGPGGGD
jgi:ABC-2 type transport system permease protein